MNILDEIRARPKPGELATWWGKRTPEQSTLTLDDEELAYFDFFTSSEVQTPLRVRAIATVTSLDDEDRERCTKRFGTRPEAVPLFLNYENRRRIVAHYVLTHPVTIQYQIELYRLTRDVNPVTFVAERVHQLFTGKEAFTGEKVSRLWAAVELLVPVVICGALKLVRTRTAMVRPLSRPLTDPLYDLPPDGGGMKINGRYYTEHALERMAPNTPQVRAELRARAAGRLERLGITPGSEAWDACLTKALDDIHPRGIPPSVVEAEILRPGSTNVRVITARAKQVVVTVMKR